MVISRRNHFGLLTHWRRTTHDVRPSNNQSIWRLRWSPATSLAWRDIHSLDNRSYCNKVHVYWNSEIFNHGLYLTNGVVFFITSFHDNVGGMDYPVFCTLFPWVRRLQRPCDKKKEIVRIAFGLSWLEHFCLRSSSESSRLAHGQVWSSSTSYIIYFVWSRMSCRFLEEEHTVNADRARRRWRSGRADDCALLVFAGRQPLTTNRSRHR